MLCRCFGNTYEDRAKMLRKFRRPDSFVTFKRSVENSPVLGHSRLMHDGFCYEIAVWTLSITPNFPQRPIFFYEYITRRKNVSARVLRVKAARDIFR